MPSRRMEAYDAPGNFTSLLFLFPSQIKSYPTRARSQKVINTASHVITYLTRRHRRENQKSKSKLRGEFWEVFYHREHREWISGVDAKKKKKGKTSHGRAWQRKSKATVKKKQNADDLNVFSFHFYFHFSFFLDIHYAKS